MDKTLKVSEQTHKRLSLYKAEHGLSTLGEAMDALLSLDGW